MSCSGIASLNAANGAEGTKLAKGYLQMASGLFVKGTKSAKIIL
jgi:hypothetical protein